MEIINTNAFRELREKENLVVDFYADWCGPCKMLSPILERLSEEYPDVKFVKINIDNDEEVAIEYNIMSIPSVFLFKDGQLVTKFVGLQQEHYIKDQLNKVYR